MEKTFEDFVKETIPLLLKRVATKIENEVKEGTVSAYWVGTVLRIDLKPN